MVADAFSGTPATTGSPPRSLLYTGPGRIERVRCVAAAPLPFAVAALLHPVSLRAGTSLRSGLLCVLLPCFPGLVVLFVLTLSGSAVLLVAMLPARFAFLRCAPDLRPFALQFVCPNPLCFT